MVSVAVIVLSLVIILLMVSNLFVSASRTYRQQKKVEVTETHTADTQGLVLVHTQLGMLVSTRKSLASPGFTPPPLVFPPAYICLAYPVIDGTDNVLYPARPGRWNAAKFKPWADILWFHSIQYQRYSSRRSCDCVECLTTACAYLAA